jgi:DNA-binding NarL/FixJ family response regulator
MGSKARITQERAYARTLFAAAETLEREAQAIRRAAEVRQSVADHLAKLETIPAALKQVRAFVDMGYAEDQAREVVADQYGLRPDALAHWQAQQERADKAADKWRRDREIMRLAWSGKTNAEIGGLHRLAPKTVSRIIAQTLRGKTRTPPPRLSKPSEVLAAVERKEVTYQGPSDD